MMARTAIASANDVKMTGIPSEHRFLTDGNCGEEVGEGVVGKGQRAADEFPNTT